MDGKSDTRKTIIELKNKPTTLNHAAKKGTLSDIRELQRKYPDYQIIVGFINDDSHRDTFDHENNVRYLGGDCLFEFVFEKKWHKKVQKEVKKIVVSFYGEKKFK